MVKANELAKQQREISISEFFAKNRHLLGFDNPSKALLTTIKEAVDNALDACEEAKILPDIFVEIKQVKEERYVAIIEDNGPGIVRAQVPKIFGKLLYGSKFHRLRMSRGQQGIGISAAAMYGQLTTGKGVNITSKIGPNYAAHYFSLHIDTQKNDPVITVDKEVDWSLKDHGTRIELELEAKYQKGKRGVSEYLRQTALANPHSKISYKGPEEQLVTYPRVINELPKEAKEIKPHPYGVELGVLIKMLQSTKASSLSGCLQSDFSRVSAKVADEIITKAKLRAKSRPKTIARKEAESLYEAIQKVKIIAPPTNCLSPIGEEGIIKSLKKEFDAEFFAACTRPPSVYRGNPFIIEAGIAYGGSIEKDGLATIMRFANKVPLLYQAGGCAVTKGALDVAWRGYGLGQSKGALPQGPLVIFVHIASVWVPFTSESKEAVAHYPEIMKDIKLAIQECGRKLGIHIRNVVRAREQKQKAGLFEGYIRELSNTLSELSGNEKGEIEEGLKHFLEKKLPLINGEKI